MLHAYSHVYTVPSELWDMAKSDGKLAGVVQSGRTLNSRERGFILFYSRSQKTMTKGPNMAHHLFL